MLTHMIFVSQKVNFLHYILDKVLALLAYYISHIQVSKGESDENAL